MAKGNACFYCKNSTNPRLDIPGWAYDCKFGIDNSTMNGNVEMVVACEKGSPRFGFQTGGHYTHMWFESCANDHEHPCLEWCVQGDNDEPPSKIHICNFEQIELFVKFWGKELRRKGIIQRIDCPAKE